MSFDVLAFDMLLSSPDTGARLRWAQARRCACLDPEGGSLLTCAICGGQGWYWDEWSEEFRATLLGLSGGQLEAMSQRWGPGQTGNATLSLPPSAIPYATMGIHDRIIALDATDVFEWTLVAGAPVKVPVMGSILEARQRANDGLSLVPVPLPVPDANGRVTVTVPTVLRLLAPRRYEVLDDIQARAWMPGLPRKITLRLVDTSVRW